MTVKLGGLAKYTKEEKQKFEGTKPLLESVPYYPERFLIHYHEFEEPKEFDLWDGMEGKRIELGNKKIVFGIEATEEEFTQYDFLWCPDGPAFVVHKKVLDKLNELCPNDIQALPIVIKNLNPKGPQFENKDFWLVNILAMADAFDKKYVDFAEDGFPTLKKKVILDSSMKDHLIARDSTFHSRVLFHPSLAKHFAKSRGILFLTDEEAP